MRRTLTTVILALGVLGCSDTGTAPTAPTSVSADVVTAAADIRSQINALLPLGGTRTAALALFDNVETAWTAAPQRTQVARQQAAALCSFVKKLGEQGKLVVAAPATTQVNALCSALNSFVAGVAGADAVAQFVPVNAAGEIIIVTPSYQAGVKIPKGAFGQDVTVIITKIDILPGGVEPLVAPQDRQYPHFFEFQTIPVVPQFAANVIVGVCTEESVEHPASRLRLAHNINNNTQLEVLPPANADFLNGCVPPALTGGSAFAPLTDPDVLFSRQVFAAGKQAARYLGSRVARVVLPTTLYASNISLGGATGSFSPFGGYDPGPSVTQSFIDFETYPATAAAGPTPTCARCIVTNEYQSLGVVFSWESTTFPSPTYGATLTSNSLYNDAAASPPNHVVTWALNAESQGLVGTVRMTFAGQPGVVEYDRTVPQSDGSVTTVTDGLGSTSASTMTVTPLGTFTSVGGVTFARQHVKITAGQGIANIALNMAAIGQTIDNLRLGPAAGATINNLAVSPTSIVIGSSGTWTANLVNPGASLSGVTLQGYLDQGTVTQAAGGLLALCPSGGVVSSGTCATSFVVATANLATGTGGLTAGPATFRLEMSQNGVVLDTKTVAVTLTNPPGPVITSLVVSPQSLQIGGTPGSWTAWVYNPGPSRSNVVFQGYLAQDGPRHPAGGIQAACPSGGTLQPGACQMTFGISTTNLSTGAGPLVDGSADFQLELIEGSTVRDTKSAQLTLTNPPGPIITSVELSLVSNPTTFVTTLELGGGNPRTGTAWTYNPGSSRSDVQFEAYIVQGGDHLIATVSPVCTTTGTFGEGSCKVTFTASTAGATGLTAGAAQLRIDMIAGGDPGTILDSRVLDITLLNAP